MPSTKPFNYVNIYLCCCDNEWSEEANRSDETAVCAECYHDVTPYHSQETLYLKSLRSQLEWVQSLQEDLEIEMQELSSMARISRQTLHVDADTTIEYLMGLD